MKNQFNLQNLLRLVAGFAIFLLCLGFGLLFLSAENIHPAMSWLQKAGFPAIPGAVRASEAGQGEWVPNVWKEYVQNGPTGNRLPDFSRAGYAMGDKPLPDVPGPVFDVAASRFGAVPDDGKDDTAAIQAAIDAAGAAGGGVVFLPSGRYEVHPTVNAPFLCITNSHVILRGQGSGPDGTILHMAAPAPDDTVRRLGTVPAANEARHRTAVAVMGAEVKHELAHYTEMIHRGQKTVAVSDTSRLFAGQPVIIEFCDPLIDESRLDPVKVDIAAQLTSPFRLVPGQNDTFGAAAGRISWIVKIDRILDKKTIHLAKPARFDQFIRYNPRIFSFNGVKGVGIEHLRFESSWPGDYRHHKPHPAADGSVIRTAKEQDYLWGALWFSHACDGWVRDIVVKDLTQGIIISRSVDFTVQDISFQGLSGHAGVTIAQSHGILVRRAHFFSRMVHPVTLKMWASGNVISDCENHYEGWNTVDGTDAAIDFHGMFPYENLFENLRGFYLCPGGDQSVLPHSGVRNVFWNIRAPGRMECYKCAKDDEFARTYDYLSTSSGTPETMFEHFPQAFFVGLRRQWDKPVKVGGETADRQNAWMTVEGLNRSDLSIPSLYQAQRRLLIQKSE